MTRLLFIPAMALFLASFPLRAQAGQNTNASEVQTLSKKPTSIPGRIGPDGRTFTADKDSRIWIVINPEMLNGMDTRHVRVKAHMDAARNQIRVVFVSAIAERPAGIKLDDAAFRR